MIALALLLAATTADGALHDARAKYDAVAYDQALAILERALAGDLPDAEKARVLAFEALVRVQMADEAGAQKSIDAAFDLDACTLPPDAPAPPRVKTMFADAKAAHATHTTAPAVALAPEGTAPPSPAPVASSGWALPAAVALGGAGALALGAGGVAGLFGLQAHADAGASTFQSDVLAKDEAARGDILVADALTVVGAVLVAGAGVAAVGFAMQP